jgi:YidC/Oxa1 family membrane protein insertase
MIGNLFNLILCNPLFNALVLIYDYIPGHDFGIAIIILTIGVRILLYPLMAQSIKSQKVLSELQPKIQELQKKYENDKTKQSQALMELYKTEKFNPFGGCLPLLAQFPILLALYRVFSGGFHQEQLKLLYSFVPNPGSINQTFLGIIDLSKGTTFSADGGVHYLIPNIVLVGLAGVTQLIQAKMMVPKNQKAKGDGDKAGQFSQVMQKQMMYMLPLFTVFILWKLPAALALYWTVGNIFSIIQQYAIYKANNPPAGIKG